jgi:hypothetical protein
LGEKCLRWEALKIGKVLIFVEGQEEKMGKYRQLIKALQTKIDYH